jgi:hypothetical protein
MGAVSRAIILKGVRIWTATSGSRDSAWHDQGDASRRWSRTSGAWRPAPSARADPARCSSLRAGHAETSKKFTCDFAAPSGKESGMWLDQTRCYRRWLCYAARAASIGFCKVAHFFCIPARQAGWCGRQKSRATVSLRRTPGLLCAVSLRSSPRTKAPSDQAFRPPIYARGLPGDRRN